MYDDYYGYKVIYTLVHETEKAFLVRDDRGEFWIPKSLTQSVATQDNRIQFRRWGRFRPEYLPEHEEDTCEMTPLIAPEVKSITPMYKSEEPDFDVIDMKDLDTVVYDEEWAKNEGLL